MEIRYLVKKCSTLADIVVFIFKKSIIINPTARNFCGTTDFFCFTRSDYFLLDKFFT